MQSCVSQHEHTDAHTKANCLYIVSGNLYNSISDEVLLGAAGMNSSDPFPVAAFPTGLF